VSVFLDDEPLASALNGRAIAVDPGSHQLRFVAEDGRTRVVDVVAREWVQGRRIDVRFDSPAIAAVSASSSPATSAPPAAPLPEPRPGGAQRTWAYVVGGVGVAALAGFGYFAFRGRSLKSDLLESCAPRCSDAQASSVSTKYLIADVLLGVGIASLGAGTYLLVSSPDRGDSPSDRGLWLGVGRAF
jgi:hypothetical protein